MSQVIDERGSLFGRFNLIDLAAIIVVVVLLPMGYVAYRVFRQPSPVIASITPSTMSVDSSRRVRLGGRYFRPYLSAFVTKTNEPYAIPERLAETTRASFLIETPTVVEMQLPIVPPGTYDLYLYDEGREVAHKTAAFTLLPGEKPAGLQPGDPIPDTAIVDAIVKLEVDAEFADLIKVGAADLNRPDGDHPATTPATIRSIARPVADGSDVVLRMADGGRLTAAVASPRTRFTIVFRLGVTLERGVRVYAGGQKIRR